MVFSSIKEKISHVCSKKIDQIVRITVHFTFVMETWHTFMEVAPLATEDLAINDAGYVRAKGSQQVCHRDLNKYARSKTRAPFSLVMHVPLS